MHDYGLRNIRGSKKEQFTVDNTENTVDTEDKIRDRRYQNDKLRNIKDITVFNQNIFVNKYNYVNRISTEQH